MRNKTYILTGKCLSKNQMRSIEKKFRHEFVATQEVYMKHELEKYKDVQVIIIRSEEPSSESSKD